MKLRLFHLLNSKMAARRQQAAAAGAGGGGSKKWAEEAAGDKQKKGRTTVEVQGSNRENGREAIEEEREFPSLSERGK